MDCPPFGGHFSYINFEVLAMDIKIICIYAICAIVGYLAGCSHMSYYISRAKSVDIKGRGSKNYGASNTLLLAGIKAGVFVFIHDVLKAVIPILCARIIFPDYNGLGELVGLFVVLGHIFPFYLKFDGGKGFASFIGTIIALYPVFGIISFLISVIIAFLGDKVVFSTFSFCLASMIYCFMTQHIFSAIVMFLMVSIIIFKHRQNIQNLIQRNGKEASIKNTVFKKKEK